MLEISIKRYLKIAHTFSSAVWHLLKEILDLAIESLSKIRLSQQEFAVWLRKLKQGLCINLEGGDAEGGGREVQRGGDICIPIADSCWGLTENNKIL